jgi:LysM repeat protein
MRRIAPSALACALAAWLLLAAPASARVAHVVQRGETLWSIAAASNLTTRSLAAANGLPETANVIAGRTVYVPTVNEAATALAGGGAAAPAAPAAGGGPGPIGAYTVRWGDTLAAIAARSGVSLNQVAWMNGLDPKRVLLAGTPLKLPTGAPNAASATTAPGVAPAPAVVPNAEPVPTPERVTPWQVEQTAITHAVPATLAAAIAKQESGYNNALVSSANARGVMQILPGTWSFIENSVAGRQINPASAQENVHAGVLYLRRLLRDTGGDEAAATAAYYQGLGSIRRIGFLPETRRYVNSVMALRRGLGGP